MLADWLDRQFSRIDDRTFAAAFSEVSARLNIPSPDFNHRIVHLKGHRLLGGIRFYGQRVDRPFVEVVAHDFDSYDDLRRCVADEWAVFRPKSLRLAVPVAAQVVPDATLDTSVYAARYGDLKPPDDRVSLDAFTSSEAAFELIDTCFIALRNTDPNIAKRLNQTRLDDVRLWQDQGHVKAIRAKLEEGVKTVGVLAICHDCIEWREGDVVYEEMVLREYGGNGFAALAQRAWAAGQGIKHDRYLLGTIDQKNAISRRTATKAGRERVLDYSFLPLAH